MVQRLCHELSRRVSREKGKLGEDEVDRDDGTNGLLIYEQNWHELTAPVPTRGRIADK